MNIYAIIPARGGSKGLPGKNTRLLNGKPLIAWTIESAKAVPEISRVIVNTDDEEIAKVARAYGAEVFMRPPELAKDETLDVPVFEHHLNALKEKGELPDMVVDLRATAPLRGSARIKEGFALLLKLGREKADSVRAVSKASKHPYKMWKQTGDFLTPFLSEGQTGMKEPYNAPRQSLPPIFQNNGCMNAFWSETVLEKQSMTGERIVGFVMSDDESVNIDTEFDFIVAEELMKRNSVSSHL
ncbi:MAG: acylneuraminate cytidylyltransferase family protein [bacterium]|nr:acylneuraminate cytidylyltransferase family protein [bacterium]